MGRQANKLANALPVKLREAKWTCQIAVRSSLLTHRRDRSAAPTLPQVANRKHVRHATPQHACTAHARDSDALCTPQAQCRASAVNLSKLIHKLLETEHVLHSCKQAPGQSLVFRSDKGNGLQ